MKRFAASLLLTGALALGAASAVSADTVGDSAGPDCTDSVLGAVSYNCTTPPVNTVTAAIGYNAPTCKDVQYTLVVDYLVGGKMKEKTQTIKGTGDTTAVTECNPGCLTFYPLSFQINNIPTTDDGNVYVYTYTSSGSKLYDRGPDNGSVAIAQDSSGGGSGGGI